MREVYTLLFYVFGLIMGSFYSLVGFRLANGLSIVSPGSFCDDCKKKLKWYHLIPILSYIFLKGKCKYCGKKISVFYPVAELLCGILFAVSFYSFGFSYELIIAILLSSLFIITMITDLNYYIIPDQINIIFAILIFVTNIFRLGLKTSLIYLLYGLVMFGIMYLLMLLGNLIFKEESLGGGDIKLLFVLGMILPIVLSFVSIVIATLIAFPIALIIYLKNRDKAIPFGPFLVAGFLLTFLLKIDVGTIYNFLINIVR